MSPCLAPASSLTFCAEWVSDSRHLGCLCTLGFAPLVQHDDVRHNVCAMSMPQQGPKTRNQDCSGKESRCAGINTSRQARARSHTAHTQHAHTHKHARAHGTLPQHTCTKMRSVLGAAPPRIDALGSICHSATCRSLGLSGWRGGGWGKITSYASCVPTAASKPSFFERKTVHERFICTTPAFRS